MSAFKMECVVFQNDQNKNIRITKMHGIVMRDCVALWSAVGWDVVHVSYYWQNGKLRVVHTEARTKVSKLTWLCVAKYNTKGAFTPCSEYRWFVWNQFALFPWVILYSHCLIVKQTNTHTLAEQNELRVNLVQRGGERPLQHLGTHFPDSGHHTRKQEV